jgi:hypothetical protein
MSFASQLVLTAINFAIKLYRLYLGVNCYFGACNGDFLYLCLHQVVPVVAV